MSTPSQNPVQLFFVTVAMVASQLVVLTLIADSDGVSGNGIAVRVFVMLGFTMWFVVLWIQRRGSKWVLALPAIVPLLGFAYAFYADLQPPPPQEALEIALTEHCGLDSRDRVPSARFIQFNDEIIIVAGSSRTDTIAREGEEYDRLRDAVLGGDSLGAERVACIEKYCSVNCDAPRHCDIHHVNLFDIGSLAGAETAQVFSCTNTHADQFDADRFYDEFDSSSGPEMERLARMMFEFSSPFTALRPVEPMEIVEADDL